MARPLLNLIMLCTITLSIIVFCIVAGGYSSFSRSQDRIKQARSFLTDACEKRLDLTAKLIELADKTLVVKSKNEINETIQKADVILQQLISHAPAADTLLIKEFETSQNIVSQQLIELLHQLEMTSNPAKSKHIMLLKKELYTVQDALFVAQKQYNNQTHYFNSRTQMFPGFLIAKLFGFNNIKYTEISQDTFLSGEKAFTSTAS